MKNRQTELYLLKKNRVLPEYHSSEETSDMNIKPMNSPKAKFEGQRNRKYELKVMRYEQ